MREVLINNRWPLILPEHRANFAPFTTPPYWETERLEHMYKHIKPGDMVYDIGAEEGDLPALWALWGAQVVLFEPNPKVWPNIRTIFETNNLKPAASFVGFAGNENRQWSGTKAPVGITFLWPECAYGPVISDHGFCQLNERPDLPCIRIDEISRGLLRPNHITIDSEGSELHVLRGSKRTLLEEKPLVWFSSHPDFQHIQYGYTESDLLAFLDSMGYRYELIAEDHERHFFAEPR